MSSILERLAAFKNKHSIQSISKNVSYSLLNTVRHLSSKEKIIIASVSTAWLGFVYNPGSTSTITDETMDEFLEIAEYMMELSKSGAEGIAMLFDMDHPLLEHIAAWLEHSKHAMIKLEPHLGRVMIVLARFLHSLLYVVIESEEGESPLPTLAERYQGFLGHPLIQNLIKIWRIMLAKSPKKKIIFFNFLSVLDEQIETENVRFILLALLAKTSPDIPLETFPTENILSFYHQLKPLYAGGWTYDSIDQTLNRLANILASRYSDGDIEEPLSQIETYGGYRYRRYIPNWMLEFKETMLLTALGSSLAVGTKVVPAPLQLASLAFLLDMDYLGDKSVYVVNLLTGITTYILGRNNYKALGVALSTTFLPIVLRQLFIKNIEQIRQSEIYKQKVIVDLRHYITILHTLQKTAKANQSSIQEEEEEEEQNIKAPQDVKEIDTTSIAGVNQE
ncbi:hypothetical protein DFA_04399 [Cavenderia fasciculata]|uniref:Uncharacterized protein n=1 Tax=Cavenderia fasciculata TaxID=261658 RepID=F4PPG8_CACFS|nr:uncharacterized protein DFA_04399 [Cavenderia fasciculata]EGG22281.1 hypothetical protein DFA_04399 [Cavenderia fasciculata]|eukprot:XP_004360132.1 hypothetical protein DFA_04399 [Cavenderia fasciculata]